MTSPLPDLLIAGLIGTFDSRTWTRGEAYVDGGHVLSLDVSDPAASVINISGEVSGSAAKPYRTSLQCLLKGKSWDITSQCTCPMESDCKHAAALAIRAIDQSDGEDMDALDFADMLPLLPLPAPSKATPAAEQALSPGWHQWLQSSRTRPVAPALYSSPPSPVPPDFEIHYVLKPFPTSVEVAAMKVPKKANGSPGTPVSFYFSLLVNPTPGSNINPEDVRLARRLMLEQPQFNTYQILLVGPTAEPLLMDLLATGRCHWKGCSKKSPPLRLGEMRPAIAVWKTEALGQQRTALQFEPHTPHLFHLDRTWYVDQQTSECGPLDANLPPGEVSRWLAAPPVPPEQAEAVTNLLASNPQTAHWPAPAKIEIKEIKGAKPVPHLRLYSATLKPNRYSYSYGWNTKEPREFHFAKVQFDYQGHKVDPGNDGEHVLVHEQGKLLRIKRHLKAERDIGREIFNTRLQPLLNFAHDYHAEAHRESLTFPDDADWFDFVRLKIPEWQAEGWIIEVDPKFAIRLLDPDDWYSDVTPDSGHDWFGAEVGIMVDGQKVNLLPILERLIRETPVRQVIERMAELPEDAALPIPLGDGRTVALPLKRAKGMLGILLELLNPDSLDKKGRLKLSRLRASELAGNPDADWRWLGPTELKALNQRLRSFTGITPVPVPAGLNAALRPYQQTGLDWLQFLREYELAGILADDMGLGKTVQTLAHLLVEKQSGRMDRPSLVIAPTSLMGNWRQEATKFTPELKVLVLHGLERKQHFDRIKEHDLIVTSYPLMPRDQAVLLENEFHYLILDEAQYIKNPKTTYAQTACQIKARHRLCLTGTPMENHLGELWSLFHFLLPGFLGDEQRFNSLFRRPIEKGGDKGRRKVLADRVSPFLLRRRKEEVVKELPPKTEIIQTVELAGAQRDLYESIRLAMHQRVLAEIDKKGMSRAHIIILDALLKLRQVCCHPKLLSLPSAQKVKESAKLELLADMLPEMIEEGRRILLFSQFTSMLEFIRDRVEKLKIDYVWLTGDTNDRETPVRRFQNGEVPLFLISLKAGGTGLNLTAADTVIHYDPWWNPAVENQATDRAHRIGQDKKVFVYKFITQGTVEEKIKEMQASKRELIEGLFDEKRSESLKLSPDDLNVLFSPLE